MSAQTKLEYTPQNRWIAIVARTVELDVEQLRRRMYERRHKRYDLAFGQARVEYDAASGRTSEHLTVMQISPDGMMLRGYDEPRLGVSATLYVHLDEEFAVLRGVVRHVTQSLGGYKIGMELRF